MCLAKQKIISEYITVKKKEKWTLKITLWCSTWMWDLMLHTGFYILPSYWTSSNKRAVLQFTPFYTTNSAVHFLCAPFLLTGFSTFLGGTEKNIYVLSWAQFKAKKRKKKPWNIICKHESGEHSSHSVLCTVFTRSAPSCLSCYHKKVQENHSIFLSIHQAFHKFRQCFTMKWIKTKWKLTYRKPTQCIIFCHNCGSSTKKLTQRLLLGTERYDVFCTAQFI